MNYLSWQFVGLFLGCIIALNVFKFSLRLQHIVLLGVSCLFYGQFDVYTSVVYTSILGFLVFGYYYAFRFHFVAILGVASTVVALLGFKLHIFALSDAYIYDPVMPLALSFVSLQAIAMFVDARRSSRAESSPLVVAQLFAFFPQLLAGPIVLMRDVGEQFNQALHTNVRYICKGIGLLSLGAVKKAAIASFLIGEVGVIDGLLSDGSQVARADAAFFFIAAPLLVYFDFSAYTDLSRGAAYLLGVELPKNFNSPLRSPTITQFWRDWHITFTRFMREYLYWPLKSRFETRANLGVLVSVCIVMSASIVWHGVGFGFFIWGLLQFFFLCIEKILLKNKIWSPMMAAAYRVPVLMVHMVAFAMFLCGGYPQVISLLQSIFVYQEPESPLTLVAGQFAWLAVVSIWVLALFFPNSDRISDSFYKLTTFPSRFAVSAGLVFAGASIALVFVVSVFKAHESFVYFAF